MALQFDARTGRYRGVQSDGIPIEIDGDAYAEARQHRVADGDSYDRADLTCADPDGWDAGMDGWIPVLFSVDDAAAILNISPQRVRALVAHRQLGRKVGWSWVLTAADIEAMRVRVPGRPISLKGS